MNSVDTLMNKVVQKKVIGENGRLFTVYTTHPSRLVQHHKNLIATKATTLFSRGFLHYYGHRYRLAEKRYTHV